MEILVFGLVLLVVFLLYVCRCIVEDKNRHKLFVKKLYEDYGKKSQKKYPNGRLSTIAGHYRHKNAAYHIDSTTWNDLDMDQIFQRMDYTFSAAGEEALYTMLRCPCLSEEELRKREQMITYFMEHEEERVSLQVFFAKMGRTGKYSIYDYISYMETLGERTNKKHFLVLGLMFFATAICFWQIGVGLFCLFVLIAYNMFAYFKEKNEIDPYITTFGYFLRVMATVRELGAMNVSILKPYQNELLEKERGFSKFARGSFLLMHQSDITSSNPLDLVLDYLRMMLHLNLIKFNQMLKEANAHKQDMIFMIETLGYVEAMISVGCYRKSLSHYTVPAFAKKEEANLNQLVAKKIYHPLIDNPVENDITLTKSLLLTGSNASGKSTFLKTIAIAQILAQTIHTVCAHHYETTFYRVYSSMALRDDLSGGDSYFMVEIKAMKRILDAANQEGVRVMSFVDEVLRGTNTVERIAASTEILQQLAQLGVQSFAATHDIELTDLLKESYENYHFEEQIKDGDVCFNYRLQKGKATSRNAIQLLGVMGFEKELIDKATKRAELFLEQGEWKK